MSDIPILSTISFTEAQLDRLRAIAPSLVVRQEPAETSAEVAAALERYPDTVALYSNRVVEDWEAGPNLRWVQVHWAGIDALDLAAIPENIVITSASGIHSVPMAEHTFALLLALRRHIPAMLEWQVRGEWAKDRWKQFVAPPLRGQTMGILGYGSIGREVARIAQAFGMTVVAYKRDPDRQVDEGYQMAGVGDPEGAIPAAYYGPDGLNDLLARSDVVVNLLPATPATLRLLGPTEFAAMRPSALFLNLGRGSTVDHEALFHALEAESIAGAALDALEPEPLPSDSPLWKVNPSRLIISPHVSGFSPGYDEEANLLWAENLRRFVKGQPLLNVVRREVGY